MPFKIIYIYFVTFEKIKYYFFDHYLYNDKLTDFQKK